MDILIPEPFSEIEIRDLESKYNIKFINPKFSSKIPSLNKKFQKEEKILELYNLITSTLTNGVYINYNTNNDDKRKEIENNIKKESNIINYKLLAYSRLKISNRNLAFSQIVNDLNEFYFNFKLGNLFPEEIRLFIVQDKYKNLSFNEKVEFIENKINPCYLNLLKRLSKL